MSGQPRKSDPYKNAVFVIPCSVVSEGVERNLFKCLEAVIARSLLTGSMLRFRYALKTQPGI